MDNYNPYIILNVSYTATQQEIKSAYKILAHIYHPDKTGGDTQQFLVIKSAYESLIDHQKRKVIDLNLMNRNQLIDLKNNALTVNQIFAIFHQLEKDIQKHTQMTVNKELLGNYLLWLFEETRIYQILKNTQDKELLMIIEKSLSLLKYTLPFQQIKFYNHLKCLREKYNRDVIKIDAIDVALKNINRSEILNKYKIVILIMSSILICIYIYLTAMRL